jgi:hypothetical protein
VRRGIVIAVICLLACAAAAEAKERPMNRLNNLVVELLNVEQAAAGSEYTFENPRRGWVFIAASSRAQDPASIRLAVDGAEIVTRAVTESESVEAMRFLAAGEHTVSLGSGSAALGSLVVRAIPELVYCRFGAGQHIPEFGVYDAQFLSKDVLPNVNTMVGGGAESERPYLELWKREGRRWIVECGVPGLTARQPVSADEAEAYWTGNPGLKDPLYDGVVADEFFASDQVQYDGWIEAIRRIAADPQFKGKAFYPYCGGELWQGGKSRQMIQTVMDAGWPLAWERYLPEQATEARARDYLQDMLSSRMLGWRAAQPGVEQHTVVCLGYMSAPPESLDVYPNVDYRVWMDMQFNMLANDPAFDRVYGVMEYLSSYASEETVRWAGRLYRHYCIEGQRTPLTRDPYILTHIQNGDFDHGLDGWAVAPAESDSVTVKSADGYSWLEGRYPQTEQGDTFLVMRRSAAKPNEVSQPIMGLQPGRLYSVEMITGDRRDLSIEQTHAVSIRVDGGEVLKDKSFQKVYPNSYAHRWGPFDAEYRAWLNYHWLVFRATAAEGKLTISDWASPTHPGGPAGQELMFNFVQVQPYLGD